MWTADFKNWDDYGGMIIGQIYNCKNYRRDWEFPDGSFVSFSVKTYSPNDNEVYWRNCLGCDGWYYAYRDSEKKFKLMKRGENSYQDHNPYFKNPIIADRLWSFLKRNHMTITELEKLEPEKKDNVVPFARPETSTGGPTTGNWLADIPEGTVFLSMKKSPDDEVEQWHLMIKWKKAGLLFRNMPPRIGEEYRIVHYSLFSAKNTLLEELGKPEVRE